MLNIKYLKTSNISLLSFIEYLKNYYKNIYFDTGLVNEDQIIDWYIDKTDKLYNEIKFEIRSTLEKWYFWNIYETTNVYEKSKLVLKVKSYTVVIDIYKSWNDVLIEDIFIN